MSVARVIVTDHGLPTGGIGSWPQRIEYLLQQFPANNIDYLICQASLHPFISSNTKRYNCKQCKNRFLNKLIKGFRYKNYYKAINKIALKHELVLLCIIDSFRVKNAIGNYIAVKGWGHKVKIIYYQCGFSQYLPSYAHELFIQGISEYIYLTKNAYQYDLQHHHSLPFPVSVLHNPVNHHLFYKPSLAEKKQLQKQLGMGDKTQFVWLSHDRPKKGLDIILDAWARFYTIEKNASLHIVGAKRDIQVAGVIFHGKIPNTETHQWFKAADIGIFSPVCQEGFGLSLAEQISSGLFCISSMVGGIIEYFNPKKHGIGISEPNMPAVWAASFDMALQQLPAFQLSQKSEISNKPSFLTYDEWCHQFLNIFTNTENRYKINHHL